MASVGDDAILIKIAVFGIAMSVMATCLAGLFIFGSGDYNYDTINAYRSNLVEFSGGELVNDNPWVLTGVYTPFTPNSVPDSDIPNHIEYDEVNGIKYGGWLFGEKIETYPDLGKASDIHLDKDQKSNQLLTVGDSTQYTYANGKEFWAGGNEFGIDLSGLGRDIIRFFGNTPGSDYGVTYGTTTANNWSYSGYRYVFDPTLPFGNEGTSSNGRLSIVWYDIPGEDTGLSGALEVYGSSGSEQVLLGRYSAYDIVQAFRSTMGYVQVFDFKFDDVHLNLTIRFSPTVYSKYATLIDAWNDGAWSMAVSSASAGNFFDVENSDAFTMTAGSTFDTFIKIFTFKQPSLGSAWADVVLWLIVSLPMTVAMLCVASRVIGGVFKIF